MSRKKTICYLIFAILVTIGQQAYGQISKIIRVSGKNYIEYKGLPYFNYAIQGRIDDYIGSWPCNKTIESTIYQYFQKTSEAGFRDLVIPVRWSWLETSDNVFDWSFVNILILNAEKYNLRIQLAWFGSNVCGYSSTAPNYILNNPSTYPLISTSIQWAPLNLSNSNLIAKETRAVAALMAYLATYDINHRVMMFQIENEPDGKGVMTQLWAGNQKSATLNLMNKIGQTVHSSAANMVTRVNLTGWAVAKDTSDYKGLTGIDIIGRDMYQDKLSTFLSGQGYFNCSWNVNHTPENGALYSNNINLVCSALNAGNGYQYYELRTTGSRTSQYDLGLYRSTMGNDWVVRDGTLKVGYFFCDDPTPRAEVIGSEVTSFNQLIYKADKKIALCSALKRIVAFNTSNVAGAVNETATISPYTINYYSPTGGEALGMIDTTGEIILLSLKNGSSFTFNTIPSNYHYSVGWFDELNNWHQTRSGSFSGNSITLNAKEVALLTNRTFVNENPTFVENVSNDVVLLAQNVPNPFCQTTTINFNLPSGARIANINMYDIQGVVVKIIPINANRRSATISKDKLTNGIYTYSLIVDGRVLETKKMIVI
jgi:hypothetical protein